MAITRYSTFDKTVNTIAERNAIVNKVNHMTVVVKDAIADPSAGAGKAIYRWDAVDNIWILISKSTYETISFITEEILIANGEVQLSNFPVNNNVWNAVVLSGQLIYADLNISAVTVANSKITGIAPEFNGKTLRVTYAYGSIAVQITTAIEDSVDAALLNNVKTINGEEIIGTGNILVEGILPEMKTINSESILGTGDITISTAFADITSKPTTISGYGITDAYTKAEVESKIVELSPPTDISMKADITYVDTKVSDVVGLAPAQLDTLKEIADQLVADEGAVSALTAVVGTKANASDVYTKTEIDSSLSNKVDKVTGKGLSTEDYTTSEKTKLSGIAVNANNYVLPIASSTVLGGVKAGTNIIIDANGVISANDTSVAWGEITSKPSTLSGYGITDSIQSTLVSGTSIKTINGTSVLGSGDITISGGATLTNDSTTNSSFYPVFTSSTSGSMTSASVSSTKLYFNPSTGTFNATEFNAFSDKNLKENINTIDNSLDIIEKLNAVSFNWKETGRKSYGVIAQELEEVLPELVQTNDSGIKSVNYDGLIGILLAAVQALSKK